MQSSFLQRQLLTIVREKLIPWAQDGAPLILIQPPVQAPPEIKVTTYPAKPLSERKKEHSRLALHLWPADELNALRVPYLGCVLEGEADLKTGITTSMLSQNPSLDKNCGRQVLALPERSFFCVPPGVPITGLTRRAHWERPHPENSHSHIIWINVLPAGIFCHLCTSSGASHVTHPFLFSWDFQVNAMIQFLLDELTAHAPRYQEMSRAQLLILLLQIERALAREETQQVNTNAQIEAFASWLPGTSAQPANEPSHSVLQSACHYIQTNANKELSPALIARHTYVSPSKLHRTFRAELGLSVMQYVAQYRIEKAKTMLTITDLSIAEIGNFVGFQHPSHFSRIFAHEVGLSPSDFRQQHQAD